jgi:peptidoglycan/LPS O-acetylase OafA/YrhL
MPHQPFNLKNNFEYNPAFDVLRTMAVFVVLLAHGTYDLFAGGWIAVDVFFVLSGYLITSLLLHEYQQTGKISIKSFYARRALRLLPALVLTILLANILWGITNSLYDSNRTIATLASVFYFVNFIKANVAGNLGHLWSLSVEEHFYVTWPLIMIFICGKERRRIAAGIVVALMVIATIKMGYAVWGFTLQGNYFSLQAHLFTPFKADAVLLGCLLTVTQWKINDKSARLITWIIVTAAFVCIMLWVSNKSYWVQAGGFLLTNLFSLLTVILAKTVKPNFLWSNKILIWLGKRSYGIYLYHLPIFALLDNYRVPHNRLYFSSILLLKILITIIIAAASFHFIEVPFLRLKKHFRSADTR